MPPGFRLSPYAEVPGARHLALAEDGTLFVGTVDDAVYAVTPKREVIRLCSGLNSPNGVAYQDGHLYIAEIHSLSRIPNVLKNLRSPQRKVLNAQLPKDRWHGYRVLRFGPDQRLYISLGAPCNVDEKPEPYGTICRFSADFQKLEVVARGVRNSMGFDWNPQDGRLWFSDNGRDMLGDEIPPEELNCLEKEGSHFGFPYRWGSNQKDPVFGEKMPAHLKPQAPAGLIPAHMAPLGLRFYQGKMFPKTYQGQIFLASHGSWNRSSKRGYQLLSARVQGSRAQVKSFVEGWLQGNQVLGRPVDVQELPDGSLLISDDQAGKITRLSYSK
jgi:glucose/arabinose dehydrogenase